MSLTDVDMAYAKQTHERFRKRSTTNDRGCYIPLKKPRNDGYVRFSITRGSTLTALGKLTGEKTFYVHQLAWYACNRAMPKGTREQLSHLCSDSRCFNIEHLVIEDAISNNSRKNCQVMATCPCSCNHTFLVCKHDPSCIP